MTSIVIILSLEKWLRQLIVHILKITKLHREKKTLQVCT